MYEVVPQSTAFELPPIPESTWILITSPRSIFCSGVLCLSVRSGDRDRVRDASPILSDYVESFLPILEATVRREVQDITTALVRSTLSADRGTLAGTEDAFRIACQRLGVAGGSLLFLRGGLDSASIELLATLPRSHPATPPDYSLGSSLTLYAVDLEGACIARDAHLVHRSLLRATAPGTGSSPTWCDLDDESIARTCLFAPYRDVRDNLYVLRLTNSVRNPTRHFHALDRLLAEHTAIVLGLLYQNAASHEVLLRAFSATHHELGRKLQGVVAIVSAIRDLLPPAALHEKASLNRKLGDIEAAVASISVHLESLKFNPSGRGTAKEWAPVRLYGDIAVPIAKAVEAEARRRSLRITYAGSDQLGPVYVDPEQLKVVVENLVNNAVKYTFPGENIVIGFRRKSGGGGEVHVMSKSIAVEEGEVELLFTRGYRSEAAVESQQHGEGIGLALAREAAEKLGGRVGFLRHERINIFSLFLPRIAFLGRGAQAGEEPKREDESDANTSR
jgi:hypothetical protein